MRKINWKVLAITCVITLLPILFGLSVWNQLPEQIAIHFDVNNQPDNFAPKAFAVFGLPLIMVAFQVFCCLMTDFGVQRYSGNKKMEQLSKWVIPVVTVVLYFVTVGYSMGWAIDIRRVAVCIVGILFVALGNYLPKLSYVKHYNFEPEVAKKINRFTGFYMVIMGALGLLSILLPAEASVVWLILLIPFGVASAVYAIYVSRKHQKRS
ncbi:MAG: DUF1648 domain-containing protein [Clostridia bacterium]|nr:DUF1648 domain-containing protein [Clostridia bacterium]